MAQPIKYNTGTTTNGCCIRKGNFDAGIVPTYPYGPTEETNFWAGYDVPVGGFVSYQRKDVQGPSIYQIPNAESIVKWGQHLGLTGNLSTPQDVIQACGNTDEIMFTNIEYPNIPLLENCVLLMDGGYTASYPWGGSNWYDISALQQVTGGTVDVTTTFTGGTSGRSYSDSYLVYQNTIGTNVPAFGSTLGTFTVNIICLVGSFGGSQNINYIGQRYADSVYTPETDCNFLIRGGANANEVEGLFRVGGVDHSTGSIDLSLYAGSWVNLTLTYNGIDLTLYVNGASVVTTPVGLTPASNGLETLIAGSVNGLAPGTGSDYFNGKVNTVHIYNTALNSTQLLGLYNAYSPRFAPVPSPYNFDVEAADWNNIGVTDANSLEQFFTSGGNGNYTSVTVSDFVYNTTRIQCNITATGGNGIALSNKGITKVNAIGGGFDGLIGIALNDNQITEFNITQPLPSTLESLDLTGNDIVKFNPYYSLPISLTSLNLSTNQMTTAGYTASQTWASNQPAFTNPCSMVFTSNVNIIEPTLVNILNTKNVNVVV